jgi:geranylgeranyl transferase type-1 subunit beta
MTYSALLALVILGDNLDRVDRPKLLAWVRRLQLPDGSFLSNHKNEGEADARFIYSASAVGFILQDWGGMDVQAAIDFILACQNVSDGGFGLRPGLESHGGATYTCLASLKLLGALDALGTERINQAIRFCVLRQDPGQGGFSGRSNKNCDTCYAYWIGGALHVLGKKEFINQEMLEKYLDTTWHPMIGGFAKECRDMPDPYHTHLGVCSRGLACSLPIEMTLGLSQRAFDRYFQGSARTASGGLLV